MVIIPKDLKKANKFFGKVPNGLLDTCESQTYIPDSGFCSWFKEDVKTDIITLKALV